MPRVTNAVPTKRDNGKIGKPGTPPGKSPAKASVKTRVAVTNNQVIDLDVLAAKIHEKALAAHEPKAEPPDDVKAATPLQQNMDQVVRMLRQVNASAMALGKGLEPVMYEVAEEGSSGEKSAIEYTGTSTISQFMRGVAGDLESLNAYIDGLRRRLEV